MSSDRSIVLLYLALDLITTYPKGCYVNILISNSKLFPKGHWGYFFYYRPPFPFDDYSSGSRCVTKKVAVYDVPCASSIIDNWVYPCCGLFKLEKWEVHYHSCADIIEPYR